MANRKSLHVPADLLDGFECPNCESEARYAEWTDTAVRCGLCDRVVAILRLVRHQDDERIAELNRKLNNIYGIKD